MVETFPDVGVSASTSVAISTKVLETEFGDGYGQRASDGINSVRRSYNVVWKNLSKEESAQVADFLEARKGVESFYWTAPEDRIAVYDGMPSLPPKGSFLRNTVAMYTAANGTMYSAPINAPRWDYDPLTHLSKGLKVEPVGENRAPYSTNITTANGYLLVQATLTRDVIAPDGTATASRLIENGATALHDVRRTLLPHSFLDTAIVSMFVKGMGRRYLKIYFFTDPLTDGSTTYLVFDTQLGVVVEMSAALESPTVQAFPTHGAWWRISVARPQRSYTSNSMSLYVGAMLDATTPSYAGTNALDAFAIWGIQHELNSPTYPQPSSLIVTAGTTPLVRDADSFVFPTRRWRCVKWDVQHVTPIIDSMSATFTQVFDQ